jgi:translation initiation factor 2 subunit 1
LTCFSFEGIDAIKQSLLNGEKKGTESVPIKFRYIRSPLYECSVNIINKKEGIKIMNLALKEVKKSIEAKGGNFSLKVEPEIEEEEKSIKVQIKEHNDKSEEEEETEEDKEIDFEEEGIKPEIFNDKCSYAYK